MTLFLKANSESNPHTHNTQQRCCFISLLVLLIDKASLLPVFEGVEGGSIVLQCSPRISAFEDKQLTVHWRHNDTRNVYDIIDGKVFINEQEPAYKNRAEVLPEELKKGQIALKLTDLQLSDRGTYLCFVPEASVHHSTQLLVKERTVREYRADQVRSTGSSLGKAPHLLLPLSGFILHILLFR